MFRWLNFRRPQSADRPTSAEPPIVNPDQVDLPTPEQRERFAAFINSGNATFGVVDGSREFEVIENPSGPAPTGTD